MIKIITDSKKNHEIKEGHKACRKAIGSHNKDILIIINLIKNKIKNCNANNILIQKMNNNKMRSKKKKKKIMNEINSIKK